MDRKKMSSEVAAQLGIRRSSLMTMLTRRPELRPVEKLPSGDYFWSDEEIERLIAARRPSGRPPKSE